MNAVDAVLLTSALLTSLGISCDFISLKTMLGGVESTGAEEGLVALRAFLLDSLWLRAVKKSRVQVIRICCISLDFRFNDKFKVADFQEKNAYMSLASETYISEKV